MTASWVESVKSKTGIRGVSQVWSSIPEWYLWIEGAPGPFDLALQHSEMVASTGGPIRLGRFTVKCYPHRSDAVFGGLSEAERRCLDSDRFDHTRTPVLETKTEIPDTYFVVGALSIAADVDQRLALFTYDSLDTFRTRAAEASRIFREVPGWRIGYTLFDRMAGLYAFYSKQRPFRFGASRSVGFETVEDNTGRTVCQETADASQLSASLLFHDPATCGDWIDALWQSRLEAAESVVFETELGADPPGPENRINSPNFQINPFWWEVATTTAHSHLSTTCGCDGDCGHGHVMETLQRP